MPRYDYKCGKCHSIKTETRTIKDKDVPAICDCGYIMSRSWNTPSLNIVDDTSGKVVRGFIEETREELEQQVREAKENRKEYVK